MGGENEVVVLGLVLVLKGTRAGGREVRRSSSRPSACVAEPSSESEAHFPDSKERIPLPYHVLTKPPQNLRTIFTQIQSSRKEGREPTASRPPPTARAKDLTNHAHSPPHHGDAEIGCDAAADPSMNATNVIVVVVVVGGGGSD